MKLPLYLNWIEVYYDERCGMCCILHEWLSRQKRAFSVRFIPYQVEEAADRFPEINDRSPAWEVVARTSEGQIIRGAEAWVWCLYSCANYRKLARRLASPALLPMAKRACQLLAVSRHCLSRVFFRRKDHKVRKTLHVMAGSTCDGVFCAVDHDEWRKELL